MDNEIPLNISLGKDESIQVKRVYDNKPPFSMVGTKQTKKGSTMLNSEHHLDILEVMENISPNAIYVLRLLRDSREISDYETHSIAPMITSRRKELSKSDQRRWDKGLAVLIANKLIASYIGKYMINPFLIIPNNFEEHEKLWNKLSDDIVTS